MPSPIFPSRRALLVLGAAAFVRPRALVTWLTGARVTATGPSAPAPIVLGLLVPGDATDATDAATRAISGIRFGAEESAHAARLLGRTVTLREHAGTTLADARALVDAGATALLTGLAPGSTAALATAEGAALGVPVLDVLEEDDDAAPAGPCRDWIFHVAPGRARRAAADSSGAAPVQAWDATLERFGAAQLNARFQARTGRPMDEAAWCGWTAAKLAGESALRAPAAEGGAGVMAALRRGRFDAHKGRALTFAECTQRLLQPVYVGRAPRLVDAALLVALLAAGTTLEAQGASGPRAPARPAATTAAAAPPRVVVSNEGSRDVSIVDLAARRVTRTIAVGHRPRGIHALPGAGGARILVALSDEHPNVEGGGDAIAELSLAAGRIVRRHKAGTDPEQFAVLPDRTRLYAANEDAGTASAYDLRTGRARATLVVGIEPEGVAASPDGRWVYVTAETSNSVSVIDTRRDSVVTTFLVDVRPRAAAFSPDGSRAWVTNEISGSVSVVDARRHEVLATIELEGGAGKPVGVVVSPDGRWVYVANGAAHVVSVIDATTLRVAARIPVGRRPWGLALSRDGRWLVTANGLSNDVSLVDTEARREVGRVKVGERPWGVAILP